MSDQQTQNLVVKISTALSNKPLFVRITDDTMSIDRIFVNAIDTLHKNGKPLEAQQLEQLFKSHQIFNNGKVVQKGDLFKEIEKKSQTIGNQTLLVAELDLVSSHHGGNEMVTTKTFTETQHFPSGRCNCGGSFLQTESSVVCRECGLVQEAIVYEKNPEVTYNHECKEDHRGSQMVEVVSNISLRFMDPLNNRTDFRNGLILKEHRWNYLARLNNRTNLIELNLRIAARLLGHHGIFPFSTLQRIQILAVFKTKITQYPHELKAQLLFAVMNYFWVTEHIEGQFPYAYIESHGHRCHPKLLRQYMTRCGLVPYISVKDQIQQKLFRIGTQLGFNDTVLLSYFNRLPFQRFNGLAPRCIVAGTLYIIAKHLHLEYSQKTIGQLCGVSDSSLRASMRFLIHSLKG